jgi:GT2 family glycosyltransferase/thioredoxin-like negative regulator of GroEL
VYAAWNIAIKASSGKYCISVSTNDCLRENACEILARTLDENLDCMLAYGNTYLTRNPHETFVENTHYGVYQWPDYRFEDLLRNCMVGPHPIWRKSVHEKIGYFDERYIADGDQEFWLRIGERYNLIHISEFTGLQWITPYSLSGEGSIPLLEVAHIHTRYQKRYAQRLKKGKLRCSIIIPLFNQVEYTKQCLEALIQNTPDELYEVIIVDNASTDGTKEFLKSLEGDVKIITNKENLGFAKACNQGAKTAQGGYLVFLNNDTKVLPGWLDELVKCAREDKKRAVVGAKLLYPDDTIQHAGVAITDSPHPIFPYHIHHKKPSNAPEVNVMREYQAVTGACMLVRKDLFEKMGGFDEDFLNGYEDVDLCFRIRENGYKIIYCPESIVYHYESVSDGRFSAVEHNVKRLHQKWLGKIHADQDSANLKQVNSVVSIIILTHNQLEYTKKCINSIFKHTKEPFELIVVDNGSTDGTVEYLESEARGQRSEVGGRRSEGRRQKAKSRGQREIIKNSENLGFAVGNNQGMAEAKGDYVLLMNNDLVVTPGWLTRMIACAERNPRIGIVGPVSNYVSGPQLIKEVSYDTTSLARLNKFSNAFSKKHAGQAKPFWRVVGFCMLIKRAVIDKIGGLDGRFGLGNFEDDDFSLRAALAGFESWIAQDCFVHHFGSRTFVGAKIDYRESLHKNWEIFKQKWGIPADVAYGAPYDMALVVKDGFIPAKHYCPLMPEEYSVADGEKLFGMDDIEGAKRIFEQILSADPNSIEALNNLGVIAFQQGGIDQAISYFTSVLETDESYFEAIENLGKCGEAQKEYLKAAEWFERALKLKPDDIGLLNSLGNYFIQAEDLESAREVYEKSLGLDGGQESIEVILRELGGLEEAKNKA